MHSSWESKASHSCRSLGLSLPPATNAERRGINPESCSLARSYSLASGAPASRPQQILQRTLETGCAPALAATCIMNEQNGMLT